MTEVLLDLPKPGSDASQLETRALSVGEETREAILKVRRSLGVRKRARDVLPSAPSGRPPVPPSPEPWGGGTSLGFRPDSLTSQA